MVESVLIHIPQQQVTSKPVKPQTHYIDQSSAWSKMTHMGHSSNLGIFENGVIEKKNFQFHNFGNYQQSLHTLGLLNLPMAHIS